MSSSSGAGGAGGSGSSSRKRELIDRVRYPNPIPLPPYPPKLVKIPTDPARFSNAHFADRLASSHPLPVLVDAHAGMPIDLARFQDLWEGDLSEISVGPTERLEPADIDDDDAFLLQDFATALPPAVSGAAPGSIGIISSLHASEDPASSATLAAALQQRQAMAIGPNAKTTLGAEEVTWLRRTEYLSAEQKKAQQAVQKPRNVETINTSREAQVGKIEQSFRDAQKPLDKLVHPTKRGVTAVSSYEFLPDPETWATDYHVVRFIDPPGRLSNGVPVVDPRLDVALFRPVDANNEQRVSYYLPAGHDAPDDPDEPLTLMDDQQLEDDKARRQRKRRRTGKFPALPVDEDDEDAMASADRPSRGETATVYKWIRDYVPKDTTESSHDVLLLSLDDGQPDEDPDADVDPIKGVKRRAPGGADEEEDDDLFGDDEDDEEHAAGGAANGQAASTAIPQSEPERKKRSRRSELTKGKERDAAPEGTGATLALKSKPKAYYHKVGMRFTLRVWRSRVANNEKLRNKDRRYPGKWDAITLSNREMTDREQLKRFHIRSQVDDMGPLDPYESSADEAEVEVEEEEAAEAGDVDGDAAGHGSSEDVAAQDGERDEQMGERGSAGADRSDAGSDAADAAAEDDNEGGRGRGRGASEEGGDNDENNDEDDDDDDGDGTDDEDAGSIDADEELAALRAEAVGAGDEGDEEAAEGGGGRRSRRRTAVAVSASADADGEVDADGDADAERTDGARQHSEGARMDVDDEEDS